MTDGEIVLEIVSEWLNEWLTDYIYLFGWLSNWLTGLLTRWHDGCLTDRFIYLVAEWPTDWRLTG